MSLLVDPLVLLIIVIAILSILYYYRSAILLRQRLKPTETREGERKISTEIPEVAECPRCGRTLEEGYLIGPGGLYWSQTAPMFDVLGSMRYRYGFGAPFGSQPLVPMILRGTGRVPYLKASRCPSCSLIYIEMGRQGLLE